jgi:NAD(P)-dependent dehydrogenase (short-subunit alcohol dehydrogenase family)
LRGRNCLITGAGSGIGRACAQRFAAAGARVACVDRDAAALEALSETLRDSVVPLVCDVADEASVADAFRTIREEFATLNVAVLAAGVYLADDSAVHMLSLGAWQRTMSVNLTGMFLTARETVRVMLAGSGGGSIVFVGSPTGIFGMEVGMHAYSASKGGVHGLARVMAHEYAAQDIRVNVVVPGCVRTGLNEKYLAVPGAVDDIVTKIPLGRIGEPEEIAGLVAWLSSDDASYATGGMFTVDGGLTAI